MMQVRFPSGGGEEPECRELEDAAAVPLIEAGEAFLETMQPDPPYALLNVLEARLTDIEKLGPVATDPGALKTVSEKVFPSGVRQNVVEGHRLAWYDGPQVMTDGAKRKLGDCPNDCPDLYSQINAVWRHYLTKRAPKLTLSARIDVEEKKRLRVISRKSGNFLDKTRDYWQADSVWFEFYLRLTAHRESLDHVLRCALEDGRILCGERTDRGDLLLHPAEAADQWRPAMKRKLSYCFSSDLPKEWFQTDEPLHKLRIRTTEWMERAFRRFAGQGRRATVKDLKQVAKDRFGLSDNAVNEAWARVDVVEFEPLHNPKVDDKVKLFEIKEID